MPRGRAFTPRSLDEALALKSGRARGSVPLQGGTDILVALNFDRDRPEGILNLAELAELRGLGSRGWAPPPGRRH